MMTMITEAGPDGVDGPKVLQLVQLQVLLVTVVVPHVEELAILIAVLVHAGLLVPDHRAARGLVLVLARHALALYRGKRRD